MVRVSGWARGRCIGNLEQFGGSVSPSPVGAIFRARCCGPWDGHHIQRAVPVRIRLRVDTGGTGAHHPSSRGHIRTGQCVWRGLRHRWSGSAPISMGHVAVHSANCTSLRRAVAMGQHPSAVPVPLHARQFDDPPGHTQPLAHLGDRRPPVTRRWCWPREVGARGLLVAGCDRGDVLRLASRIRRSVDGSGQESEGIGARRTSVWRGCWPSRVSHAPSRSRNA